MRQPRTPEERLALLYARQKLNLLGNDDDDSDDDNGYDEDSSIDSGDDDDNNPFYDSDSDDEDDDEENPAALGDLPPVNNAASSPAVEPPQPTPAVGTPLPAGAGPGTEAPSGGSLNGSPAPAPVANAPVVVSEGPVASTSPQAGLPADSAPENPGILSPNPAVPTPPAPVAPSEAAGVAGISGTQIPGSLVQNEQASTPSSTSTSSPSPVPSEAGGGTAAQQNNSISGGVTDKGVAIGIAFGVLGLITILGLGIFFFLRRRKRKLDSIFDKPPPPGINRSPSARILGSGRTDTMVMDAAMQAVYADEKDPENKIFAGEQTLDERSFYEMQRDQAGVPEQGQGQEQQRQSRNTLFQSVNRWLQKTTNR